MLAAVSMLAGQLVGANIVRGLVARAAVQLPVWENVNGIQDVEPAFTAGLTYVF